MHTMRIGNYLLILAAFLLSGPARADALACLIQPYQEADIGSPVVGVLDHVSVERGDFVKRGQPLAQLNADVERAALQSADMATAASETVPVKLDASRSTPAGPSRQP
jgi:multidrug efflux pump subunit AcrA (membrane-fusion protein)